MSMQLHGWWHGANLMLTRVSYTVSNQVWGDLMALATLNSGLIQTSLRAQSRTASCPIRNHIEKGPKEKAP